MATKDALFKSLKETIISDGKGLSANMVVAVLRRIEGELTAIAMDTTDAGMAVENYAVDYHGKVYEKTPVTATVIVCETEEKQRAMSQERTQTVEKAVCGANEYQRQRAELYDQITELLSNSSMPWFQARSVLMQIDRDISIAEGKMSAKEMVAFLRSARRCDSEK